MYSGKIEDWRPFLYRHGGLDELITLLCYATGRWKKSAKVFCVLSHILLLIFYHLIKGKMEASK
jgi:hypothetical protein